MKERSFAFRRGRDEIPYFEWVPSLSVTRLAATRFSAVIYVIQRLPLRSKKEKEWVTSFV